MMMGAMMMMMMAMMMTMIMGMTMMMIMLLSHQAKAEECTAPTNDGRSESRRSRAGT